MEQDISIIGGGLVGSLAALSIARQGFKVALIDPKKPAQLGDTPDLRVSALNPFSWKMLHELGVTAKLDSARFSKILGMEIFEETDNPLHLYASEVGQNQLGVIIENEVLLQAIHSCFSNNIELIPQKCEKLQRHATGFNLTLDNGQTISTHFLILAQGHEAALAHELNIPFKIFDYQEEALVFHVASDKPHKQMAYQRFLPQGPLAFLPLYQDRWSSIVWTLPRKEAQSLKTASPAELSSRLKQVFPYLGNLQTISPVASFPMYAQQALKVAGQHFVLMGDAAHSVHPLAGQGLNLGFRDVAQFCKILRTISAQEFSLHDPALGDHYTKATLNHNHIMSQGFSLIHYFYASPRLFKLRQIGTKYLNRFIPLKKELIKLAMGEHNSY